MVTTAARLVRQKQIDELDAIIAVLHVLDDDGLAAFRSGR
jgi:hypothetical protein